MLDNAVKYAAEGTEIRFSLSKAHRGVTVRCSNECESLDTAELDKLFDRFYRADKSRSSGGFGIGLSIARSIAEGHKGSIKAVSPDGRTIDSLQSLNKERRRLKPAALLHMLYFLMLPEIKSKRALNIT